MKEYRIYIKHKNDNKPYYTTISNKHTILNWIAALSENDTIIIGKADGLLIIENISDYMNNNYICKITNSIGKYFNIKLNTVNYTEKITLSQLRKVL